MGIKINLTAQEVKDAQGGFTPVEEGIYTATIYEAKLATSKAKNQMYVINYKIIDGPEVRKNYKIKSWYVLAPQALFSVIGLNKAVGFPYPTKDTPEGEFEFNDPEDYLGKEVNIRIVSEDYQTVDDDDNEITAQRSVVKAVYKFDPDKITGADDTASAGSFSL